MFKEIYDAISDVTKEKPTYEMDTNDLKSIGTILNIAYDVRIADILYARVLNLDNRQVIIVKLSSSEGVDKITDEFIMYRGKYTQLIAIDNTKLQKDTYTVIVEILKAVATMCCESFGRANMSNLILDLHTYAPVLITTKIILDKYTSFDREKYRSLISSTHNRSMSDTALSSIISLLLESDIEMLLDNSLWVYTKNSTAYPEIRFMDTEPLFPYVYSEKE
jgi:hypothetical protein